MSRHSNPSPAIPTGHAVSPLGHRVSFLVESSSRSWLRFLLALPDAVVGSQVPAADYSDVSEVLTPNKKGLTAV